MCELLHTSPVVQKMMGVLGESPVTAVTAAEARSGHPARAAVTSRNASNCRSGQALTFEGACPRHGRDLRKMREAKFVATVTKNQRASVTINTPVTENVTLNTPPVTANTPIPKLKRGRPKTGKALSGAKRTRRYRQRLREGRQ